MNISIFGAPGRYIQGAGAIAELGGFLKPLGSRVLVTGGHTGLEETRTARAESFSAHAIEQVEEVFRGETCDSEIARVAGAASRANCSVIMASGGGKVIDTVKAAAESLDIPAVIVPTIASNDAPCSALAVIYNEDGTFARLMPLKRSPALVIADTEIIARSPVRQLVSGMGDALATWFEAEACFRSGALNNFGANMTMAALAIAKLCLDTLLQYGREARASCEQQLVTPALDRIVEANILLSGLGFESGGVAVAHALSESLTLIASAGGSASTHEHSVEREQRTGAAHSLGPVGASAITSAHAAAQAQAQAHTHAHTHGEMVAFGLLVHMVLAGRPDSELNEIRQFCKDVDLPVTAAELGFTDAGDLRAAAEDAASPGKPSHNLKQGITGAEIFEAMMSLK